MKLRTSYFNATVLKKDITRFAPLWGLYTVFMLLFLLLIWDGDGYAASARFMNNASGIMGSMCWVNFFYCGLSALLLFGDLSNSRLCNALHAMPMRREGWFLTHLAAGFLFCLGPNLLGTVIAAVMLQEYFYGAFLWLAVMVLQFLIFFGIGVFCALCAGNKLGAVVMYALVNFFSIVVMWLAMTFYVPVLPGVVLGSEAWARTSPVVGLTGRKFISTHFDNMKGITVFGGFVPEDWRYLFIAAAVGVAFLALALVAYRRRKLETAGDLISAKPAAPVFLVLYTLAVGAVLYAFGAATTAGNSYVLLAVGLAIGFFTGRMLLERRVKVFHKKALIAFGVFLAAFAASVGITWLDPAGITRYVPEPAQVESVSLSPYFIESYKYSFTDPEDISAIVQMHSYLVEKRSVQLPENRTTTTVSLRYQMKNGTTVDRQYTVELTDEVVQTLREFNSRPGQVLGTEDTQDLLQKLYVLEFQPNNEELSYIAMGIHQQWTDVPIEDRFRNGMEPVSFTFNGSFAGQPEAEALIKALEADCLAGNMAQRWELRQGEAQVGVIVMQISQRDGSITYRDIVIYENCENTVAYLKSISQKKPQAEPLE